MRSNYDISMIEYTELEYKIVVPKFQRRLVWSKKTKARARVYRNAFKWVSIWFYSNL